RVAALRRSVVHDRGVHRCDWRCLRRPDDHCSLVVTPPRSRGRREVSVPYSRVVRQFLRLLGPPVMEVAGRSISLDSQRPTLILLYLAYKRRWVSRTELVALMWPDTDEVKARHALRSSLYRAKRFAWVQGLEIELDRVR